MAKSGDPTTPAPNPNMQLSKDELDRVTEVFKMYETGLREATIYPKVRKCKMYFKLYKALSVLMYRILDIILKLYAVYF